MEAFVTALAIVASVYALSALYRLNRTVTALHPVENHASAAAALRLMNAGGRWLTFAGAVATLPLVAVFIFDPSSSTGSNWIAPVGLGGCLALVAAALLLVPALLGNGLIRPGLAKHLLAGAGRFLLNRSGAATAGLTKLARRKRFWLWTAVAVAALVLLPYLTELITGLAYLAGMIVAGRLGLLDTSADIESRNYGLNYFYNYATGKFDNGLSAGGMYDDDW